MPHLSKKVSMREFRSWGWVTGKREVASELLIVQVTVYFDDLPPITVLEYQRNEYTIQQLAIRDHLNFPNPEWMRLGHDYWLFVMDDGAHLRERFRLWYRQ